MRTLVLLAQIVSLVSGGYNKKTGVFMSNSTNFNEEFDKLQALLGLRPGMTYCEMGAANGKFMVPLGKAVMPGGRVIVTEVTSNALPLLEKAARKAGIEASAVLATNFSMGLPAEACDVIMSRMVYHMVPESVAVGTYLPQLKQALKRSGKMLILDHDPDTGATTRANATLTGGKHSMVVVPRLQEIREFTLAGFALVQMLEWPWFGEGERGFALMWIHPAAEQQSSPMFDRSLVLQELDRLGGMGVATTIFAGISAAFSFAVLVIVCRLTCNISDRRLKLSSNDCDSPERVGRSLSEF